MKTQRILDVLAIGGHTPWLLDGDTPPGCPLRYQTVHAPVKGSTRQTPLGNKVLHNGIVPIVTILRPFNSYLPTLGQ